MREYLATVILYIEAIPRALRLYWVEAIVIFALVYLLVLGAVTLFTGLAEWIVYG